MNRALGTRGAVLTGQTFVLLGFQKERRKMGLQKKILDKIMSEYILNPTKDLNLQI